MNGRREFIKGIAAGAAAAAVAPLGSGSPSELAVTNVPTAGAFYRVAPGDWCARGWFGLPPKAQLYRKYGAP